MKDIDLVKLKALAKEALNDEWIDVYELAGLSLEMIEQLEAAQRELDELKENLRVNSYFHKVSEGACDVVNNQRDHWMDRAKEAEAELKRRDDAVPVPTELVYSSVLPKFIGDTDEVESYSCFIHGNTPPRKTMEEAYADAKEMCGPLYAAAPAVALCDIEPLLEGALELHGLRTAAMGHSQLSDGFRNGARWAAKALGCQPEKVVKMPGTKCIGWLKDSIKEHDEKWKAALDAAGVKWEESK